MRHVCAVASSLLGNVSATDGETAPSLGVQPPSSTTTNGASLGLEQMMTVWVSAILVSYIGFLVWWYSIPRKPVECSGTPSYDCNDSKTTLSWLCDDRLPLYLVFREVWTFALARVGWSSPVVTLRLWLRSILSSHLVHAWPLDYLFSGYVSGTGYPRMVTSHDNITGPFLSSRALYYRPLFRPRRSTLSPSIHYHDAGVDLTTGSPGKNSTRLSKPSFNPGSLSYRMTVVWWCSVHHIDTSHLLSHWSTPTERVSTPLDSLVIRH